MLAGRNVRELIEQEIRELMLDSDAAEEELSVGDDVLQFEVDSMMLARLLIQLEAELGVDPFEEQADIADIRTITDLVKVYEQALSGADAGAGA